MSEESASSTPMKKLDAEEERASGASPESQSSSSSSSSSAASSSPSTIVDRLWDAAAAGDDAALAALLETADGKAAVNEAREGRACLAIHHSKPALRCTPLCVAAQNKHVSSMRLLLAAGADVVAAETMPSGEEMALTRRAARALDIDVVRTLLDAGGDVNAVDEHKMTPLFVGVFFDKLEFVEFLIGAGADVHHVSAQASKTALAFARSAAVVRALVKAGARLQSDVARPEPDPFVAAARGERYSPATNGYITNPTYSMVALGRKEAAVAMLEAGADPNGGSHDGDRLLHAAVNKMPEDLQWLLDAGADPLAANDEGLSATVLAAQLGYDAAEKSQGAQSAFKTLLTHVVSTMKVHPFAPQPKSRGGPACLVTQVSTRAPHAVEALTSIFVVKRGTWNQVDYCRVSFGQEKEHYDFLASADGLAATQRMLEDASSSNPALLATWPMRALLSALWQQVARTEVIVRLSLLVGLLLALCALIAATSTGSPIGSAAAGIGVATAVLGGVAVLSEARDLVFGGRTHSGVPLYFTDPWNLTDLIAYASVVYGAVLVVVDGVSAWTPFVRGLIALSVLYLFSKLSEFGGAFAVTSPVVRLFALSIRALLSLLLFFLVLLVCFSFSLLAIDSGSTLIESVTTTFRVVALADVDADPGVVRAVILGVLVVIGTLIFLNLIIATLANEYDKVQSDAKANFLLERSATVAKLLHVSVSTSKWKWIVQNVIYGRNVGIRGIIGPSLTPHLWATVPWKEGLLMYAKRVRTEE